MFALQFSRFQSIALTCSTVDGRIYIRFKKMSNPSEKPGLVDCIGALLENNTMSDVTFIVEGQRIAAHHFVLAVSCNASHEKLLGLTSPLPSPLPKNLIVQIADTSAATFKAMLRYIYTGRTSITSERVVELLQAARKYRLHCLSDACADVIKRELGPANALATFEALHRGGGANWQLEMHLLSYIINNFFAEYKHSMRLTSIEDRGTLRYLVKQLVDIERPADDGGRFELNLFRLLIEWASRKCAGGSEPTNAQGIRSYLDGMEQLIRFEHMSVAVLNKCIRVCPDFFSYEEIGRMLQQTNEPNACDLSMLDIDDDDTTMYGQFIADLKSFKA